MSGEPGSPAKVCNRIAVFIDADNISQARLSFVFDFLRTAWAPFIRRAYGVRLSEKRLLFQQFGIDLYEVPENVPRKNSTDIALVVDVMEQLCLGIADAFAIIASDSDYTRLATRLRERGKVVLVFGEANTPQALRNASDQFVLLDATTSPPKAAKKAATKSAAKAAPRVAAQPATKPALKPATKTAAKTAQKPAKKTALKKAVQRTPKLKQEPAAKPATKPAPEPAPAKEPSPNPKPLSDPAPTEPELPIDDLLVSELHRLFDLLVRRSIEPTLQALEKLCYEQYPQFSPKIYSSFDPTSKLNYRVQGFTDLIRKSKAFDLVRIKDGQGKTPNYRLSVRAGQPQSPSAPAQLSPVTAG